jgi:hypothetical protein
MVTIGVVHLVWAPLGPAMLARFLDSYRRCPGGIEHDLIVAFAGYRNQEELEPFLTQLHNVDHQALPLAAFQQDLASYRDAIERCDHEYLCFVNSYTRLCDGEWLAKLYGQMARPGIGVVGTTGSWENRIAPLAYERERIRRRPLPRRLLSSLHLAYRLRRSAAFPNYHIRTNAFLLRRDLALSLQGMRARDKCAAWQFEHGKASMTRQLMVRGLEPLVVDRYGRGYGKEEWGRSNTFWQGDQGSLLATDNRTDSYAEGTAELRYHLWRLAWHEQAIPPSDVNVAPDIACEEQELT